MAWIESHQSLLNHRKTGRLARNLGISKITAIGHLHAFWWWCMDNAPDGDLSDIDAEDIADGSGWEGEPERFITALIFAGFVDGQDSEPPSCVHDWYDYAGRLIERREKDAERKRLARLAEGQAPSQSPPKTVRRTSSGHPADGARTVPNPTVPNPTVPNPSGDGGSPPPRPLSPAPRPAIAAHPLPSIESLIDQLTPWATKKGITDILADEVERFHLHCLTKIDPVTGRAPGKREPMYLNYAAACQKWITNPNYDHAPRSRAPAQPFGRSNAQAREDELLTNVYAFNPPERQIR